MALLETEIPIQKLSSGAVATVASLQGSSSEIARLAELGVRRGARIQVIRKGRPCIIQLGATRMCIRPSRDLRILVFPE